MVDELSPAAAQRNVRKVHFDSSDEKLVAEQLIVKNTFLTMNEPKDPSPMRSTKSLPSSFRQHFLEKGVCENVVLEHTKDSELQQLPTLLTQMRALSSGPGHSPQLPFPQTYGSHGIVSQEPLFAQPGLIASVGSSEVPASLQSQVWRLSQDAQGCRVVQRALEEAESDAVRRAIALELTGHVGEATTSPHGNFVVQKCIALLPATALDFIIVELCMNHIPWVARNKFGCRVLQRLLEKCPPAQLCGVVDALLPELAELARHPYGNYVVQHLLEHASAGSKRRVVVVLASEARRLVEDYIGCAVVIVGLSKGAEEHRRLLARTLVNEPELLTQVACARRGHVVVSCVLQLLRGAERDAARGELAARREILRQSRFGRRVIATVL